ncbi:MAG TPA: BTAD domain-containing putative transcriptional regulator [Dongiaceae bacterium]
MPLPSRKARALLGYLALRQGTATPRTVIAGLLWGERSESQARASLRQALSELRAALAEVTPQPIVSSRDALTWTAGSAWIDARIVEVALRAQDTGSLRDVVDMFCGELLEGLSVDEPGFEQWLAGERERFRQLAGVAGIRLMDEAERSGRLDEALAHGVRLLSLDPLREQVHRAVMRLYVSQGRHDAALAQYERCRELLARQLAVQPESETDELARLIRAERRAGATARQGVARPTPEAGQSAGHSRPSIAVLAFDNIGGDPDETYFSDGITDDIITELSRFRELLVIARNSSFAFRGKAVDIQVIARMLGAQFVVEGSVRRAGKRIRMNVQMIDAASMTHIWADRYDRDVTDMFEIQDQITQMVVTQIASQSRSALVHRNRSRSAANLSAYDCLLRARQAMGSLVTAVQSEPLLLKAIELDPDLVVAHAMLGYVHCVKYYYQGDQRHLIDALEAGQTALRLDPEEPWASYTLGTANLFLRRMQKSGYFVERAIAQNPNEPNFLAANALRLCYLGEVDAALRGIDEALRRDPIGNDWFWDVRGCLLTSIGCHQEAIDAFRHLRLLGPWNLCYLAICHIELGHAAELKAVVEEFRGMSPGRSMQDVIAKEPYVNPATSSRLVDAAVRAEQTL